MAIVGINQRPEKLQSGYVLLSARQTDKLQDYFIGVQSHTYVLQILPYRLQVCLQAFARGIEQIEIIHIPAITIYTESFRYEPIQTVEIDIGKQLRGQIADRKPYPIGRMPQRFRRRKIFSIGFCTAYPIVVKRVLETIYFL